MKRNRKLKTIIVVIIFLLFPMISCVTVERVRYISPELPDYNPLRPTRPLLLEVEDGLQLPIPLIKNTILLQGYARELEEYSEGWERFYKSLKEELEDENI